MIETIYSLLQELRSEQADTAVTKLRKWALSTDKAQTVVTDLASVVLNEKVPIHDRVVGLYALAQTAAVTRTPLPATIAEAMEDTSLVDEALSLQMEPALTATLYELPKSEILQETRRIIARRLVAREIWGPHVTRLLIDCEDWEAASRAACADYIENISRETDIQKISLWIRVLLQWSEIALDSFFVPFVARLHSQERPGIRHILMEIRRLPEASTKTGKMAISTLLAA